MTVGLAAIGREARDADEGDIDAGCDITESRGSIGARYGEWPEARGWYRK
jgi:hypothetical protein